MRQQNHSDPILGKTIPINTIKVKVLNKISEGAFGDVFKVQRTTDNQVMALKRLYLQKGNEKALKAYQAEMNALKKLCPHQNIVTLIGKEEKVVKKSKDLEVYILMELCPGGTLYNLIEEQQAQGAQSIDEEILMDIFSDIVNGIIRMHLQDPPIVHRDIKIENILKGSDGRWKLCDFGSSTTTTISVINDYNRYLVQEDIEQNTTQIYRAPEQLDLYSGYPINEKVDIWQLACVIYTLMYFKSPFNPGERLAQMNANVKIPSNSTYSRPLIDLLQMMFIKDPNQRIGIGEVWSILDSISITKYQQIAASPDKTIKEKDEVKLQFKKEAYTQEDNFYADFFKDSQQARDSPTSPVEEVKSNKNRVNYSEQKLKQKTMEHQNQNTFPYSSNMSSQQKSQSMKFTEPILNLGTQDNMLSLVVTLTLPQELPPPYESDYRVLIRRFHANRVIENDFYQALAKQDFKVITIVALKTLIVTHKLQLYCPFVNMQSQYNLYDKLGECWKNTMVQKLKNPKDQFRCEYFARLICDYSEILKQKCQLAVEYKCFIDGGYTLKHYFSQNGTGNSPLQVKFIAGLNKLWCLISHMQSKLLKSPHHLWGIRLHIVINIIEDQYLLLALLTHLIFTFKTVYQRYNNKVPQTILDFIMNFEKNFDANLKQYISFIEQVKTIPEFKHIQNKFPIIPPNLGNDLKIQNIGRLNQQQIGLQNGKGNGEFVLADYINIKNNIMGLQIPVPFKLYEHYMNNIPDHYELLIGTQIYRAKLGEIYANMQAAHRNQQKNGSNQMDNQLNRQKFMSNEHSNEASIDDSSRRNSKKGSNSLTRQNSSSTFFASQQQNNINQRREDSANSNSEKQVLNDQDLDFLRLNILSEGRPEGDQLLHFDHVQQQIKDILLHHHDLIFEEQQNLEVQQNDFNMQWNNNDQSSLMNSNLNYQQQQSNGFQQQMRQPSNGNVNTYSSQSPDYLLSLIQKNQPLIQLKPAQNNEAIFSKSASQFNLKPELQSSGEQSQRFIEINMKHKNMVEEQKRMEDEFERLKQQQETEIKKQTEIILKMKLSKEQEVNIKQKEEELKQQKIQFQLQQKQAMNQKMLLDEQIKKFEEERRLFEAQRKEQERKIKEEQIKIEDEKRKLEAIRQSIIDQHEKNKEEHKKNVQLLEVKEKQLKLQELEESKQSSMLPKSTSQLSSSNAVETDSSAPNEFLKKIFQEGSEQYLLKLTDLKIEQQIGQGASAEVYKGTYKLLDVAIKKLRVGNITNMDNTLKEFKREVSTLTRCRHPNLVMFMGASADQGHIVIVTEFCGGGTLFTLLHEKKSIDLSWKQRYMMALDIAVGMHFLHSEKPPILHRDLKSLKQLDFIELMEQNSLLMAQPVKGKNDFVQVKITDFGLSRRDLSTSVQEQEKVMMTGQAGTFHWMSPEILENKPYTHKADVYSYGIVLWEIICREPPFKQYNPHDIMYRVINFKERPNMKIIPPDCPKELIAIMVKCWEQEQEKRPDFEDIVKALRLIKDNIQN